MLGKRTRSIPKKELLLISTEIKRFKETMKKRVIKGDENKSKKNPVLVAKRKVSLEAMVDLLK
jgi:hypothetical protein